MNLALLFPAKSRKGVIECHWIGAYPLIDARYCVVEHKQFGIALAATLILLVVFMLTGVVVLSTSQIEERMAGNERDKALSFQAAESALRQAEHGLAIGTIKPEDFVDCSVQDSYLCILTQQIATQRYDVNGTVWDSDADTARHVGKLLVPVAAQPRFYIEQLPPTEEIKQRDGSLVRGYDRPNRFDSRRYQVYRITARGLGQSRDAQTMLQSTYVPHP